MPSSFAQTAPHIPVPGAAVRNMKVADKLARRFTVGHGLALSHLCARVGTAEAPRGRRGGTRNFAHALVGSCDRPEAATARWPRRASAGRTHRMDCPGFRCGLAWRAPGITPAT